ncbi:copper homeostasis protein CutC [Acidicapsa acidisoli]|uniref:copper homeostasis protein CutC n=1 Tax=Acidicapsa acidisoli TaxID=1615681 RepID=UPI0021DF8346|nr:copper homeostasis protein CutC [Acidicapsa acidisoli]
MMELEICVDSVESAIAAELGGAQRVELCSALSEGGLTPSLGLVRAVRSRISIGINVMIRPRGGDFLYSDDEFSVMRDDLAISVEAGANGVVFGLLTADGDVDVERTGRLVEEAMAVRRSTARPIEVTFHRAIDMARSLEDSLEDVVRTGAQRILTSGAAQSAVLGSSRVAGLVRAAQGRIGVMVCGNVRPENVQEIALATGAREFHAALRRPVESPVLYRNPGLSLGEDGNDEYTRNVVVAEDVRNLRQAMDSSLSYSAKSPD